MSRYVSVESRRAALVVACRHQWGATARHAQSWHEVRVRLRHGRGDLAVTERGVVAVWTPDEPHEPPAHVRNGRWSSPPGKVAERHSGRGCEVRAIDWLLARDAEAHPSYDMESERYLACEAVVDDWMPVEAVMP